MQKKTQKYLFNGEPHGLTIILGFDDLLFQFIKPLTRFEHSAHDLIPTHEDATLRVLDGITHVDADALEQWHT